MTGQARPRREIVEQSVRDPVPSEGGLSGSRVVGLQASFPPGVIPKIHRE